MKSLVDGLRKKGLDRRPVSINNLAQMMSLSRPFNLSKIIELLKIEQPLAPRILSPQSNQAVQPNNVNIRWQDPGKGTSREATSFSVEVARLNHFSKRVDGQINQIILPTLEFDAEYICNILPFRSIWPGAFGQVTFRTVHQQTTVGFSKIRIFNCNSSKHQVTIWLFDRNLQQWDNKGDIDQQYDESGTCPGVGEDPFEADLEDGHIYDLVCVDTELPGCSANDPRIQGCQRKFVLGIVGKTGGLILDGSVVQ